MNDNRTISEILEDYEKTFNSADNVTISVGRRSISFNKANLAEEKIGDYVKSIFTFLSSEEGQRVIPEMIDRT